MKPPPRVSEGKDESLGVSQEEESPSVEEEERCGGPLPLSHNLLIIEYIHLFVHSSNRIDQSISTLHCIHLFFDSINLYIQCIHLIIELIKREVFARTVPRCGGASGGGGRRRWWRW
jgi:hypothetical protein